MVPLGCSAGAGLSCAPLLTGGGAAAALARLLLGIRSFLICSRGPGPGPAPPPPPGLAADWGAAWAGSGAGLGWAGAGAGASSGPVSGSYVTSVTVSSMCLCCTGQQARRCSVNIGNYLS